jgi:hypothetical protein
MSVIPFNLAEVSRGPKSELRRTRGLRLEFKGTRDAGAAGLWAGSLSTQENRKKTVRHLLIAGYRRDPGKIRETFDKTMCCRVPGVTHSARLGTSGHSLLEKSLDNLQHRQAGALLGAASPP